jgi:hypothetical protein
MPLPHYLYEEKHRLKRIAKNEKYAGEQFSACKAYPKCKTIKVIDAREFCRDWFHHVRAKQLRKFFGRPSHGATPIEPANPSRSACLPWLTRLYLS